ncbi:ABC transporter ATP-binding protein [Bifidobacterium saguinibicoloris]|uniref:ABC transporter ATP-binding protein n=1 Tax=Bifidobacterium saguinibicoloris TaxID=2834433 RepID=UPI001C55BDBC|nr:ABC transporter ATP-binding protein [Bifidobacterium saguinibicoloris]MBW3080007.1 ABC transporter ATP-binding protein [Bifidobacterium saguinibicoloris]
MTVPVPHLLHVEDLTKCFTRRGEPFDAVSHVSLVVDEGEFVAIVGRSGNGKSTLINMIAGLVRPTSGFAAIDGRDVSKLRDRELSVLRNRTLGFVTQGQTLLPNLTVLDNVVLPATMFPDGATGRSGGRDDEDAVVGRALGLLRRLGVEDLAGCRPRELSGGEARRVSIARALMNGPRLLIADEPTGDLDQESTGIVMGLLRESADHGTAILMVTHDPDALKAVDRIHRMDAGRLSEALPA